MKKRKKKKFGKSIAFFLCFCAVFFSLYYSSNRIMEEIAQKSYVSTISGASYEAIGHVVDEGYSYDDLMQIEKDVSGNIVMVISDSRKVNALATSVAKFTFDYLSAETKKGVDVPLGAFTGIRLIGGFGVPVRMKLISVTSVKCKISSSFESAGFNQTRHLVILEIVSDVSLITKFHTKEICDSIEVLVYDNLIVGKVPAVLVDTRVIGEGNA